MLLTNDVMKKIESVFVRHFILNILKFIYVIVMICVCAYASYNNSYGFFYHRIVSFVLTANVIWILFDLFYSPLREIIRITNERKR